ncbi:MAG TPA: hypothetical protein VGF24_16315 [Vicinamibacterales bacterium]|jgi:hypothetical protein
MKVQMLAGATLLVATAIVIAQDRDRFTGTWTLNVAKSTMVSPSTASKSETVTYRHVNGEEIYASDAVTANGEPEHTDYRGVYDGPLGTIKTTIAGKVTSEGALQLRQLDPRTRLRIAMRKDGTLNGIIVRRLAEDGRSITSSILRFDNDGRVVVYETRWFDKK